MKIKLLPLCLAVTFISACTIRNNDTLPGVPDENVSDNGASQGADAGSNNTSDSDDGAGQVNEDGQFVFNPHVFSAKETEYRGEEIRDTFFNFIDALRNGEDTYECASEEAYDWSVGDGRLANYYFPIASNYTTGGGYENGVGHITYLIPKDEFLEKEKEFEYAIEDVLNEYVDPSYSDFEKALGLYIYMTQNYTYDYVKYDQMSDPGSVKLLTIDVFESKTGVCQELSGLYAYLLLQCGVEADIISAVPGDSNMDSHQWNLVTIDGIDYHVDTTFGLHNPDYYNDSSQLDYFLMTDEERQNNSGYDPAIFGMFGMMGEESREYLDYWATDDRYSDLHNGYYVYMDTDNDFVEYCDYTTQEIETFYY